MCCLRIIQNKIIEDNTSILKKYTDLNQNDMVNKALLLIKSNYMYDISLDNLAEQVYVHPIYLSRLIKNNLNESFIKILNEYRLSKAAWYLGTTQKKVYEISEMVGVKDSRYFGYIFKKNYGITPLQYRDYIKGFIN